MNLSDYGRSVIRTVVPLLVGTIVGWLATKGVKVDQTAATAVADTAIAGAYYAIVRWLEHKYPKAGWLLGAPGAPSYGSSVVSTSDAPSLPTPSVALSDASPAGSVPAVAPAPAPAPTSAPADGPVSAPVIPRPE